MLSRIANCLYWMARSLERADNTARLIEINLLYLVEATDVLSEMVQWRPMLSIGGIENGFAQRYDGAEITAHKAIQFMTQERANPSSIHTSVRLARENARIVRDRISKEMWEAMNEVWLYLDHHLKSPLLPERAAGFYARVRSEVARFHGLTESTMMRGEAFGFYRLGTFVERADMTARILDVKYHLLLPDLSMVGSPFDYYQWVALLKSLSGFEAYRRHSHADSRPIDIADFVIFRRDFPRSLCFSVECMQQAVKEIGTKGPESLTYAALSRMMEELEHHSVEEMFFKQGLHEFLQEFLAQIAAFHAALAAEYL
ncbi:MAG: alpha-E domain-containing protein [Candidatus Methylomirabilaceae bacterium]